MYNFNYEWCFLFESRIVFSLNTIWALIKVHMSPMHYSYICGTSSDPHASCHHIQIYIPALSAWQLLGSLTKKKWKSTEDKTESREYSCFLDVRCPDIFFLFLAAWKKFYGIDWLLVCLNCRTFSEIYGAFQRDGKYYCLYIQIVATLLHIIIGSTTYSDVRCSKVHRPANTYFSCIPFFS